MKPVRFPAVAVLLSLLFSPAAFAADAANTQMSMNPADIKWGDAPPSLPKGAKIAVLSGDPGKSGPYVARIMVPAGYKIPPHWHSQTENLTILKGTLYLGDGDKLDTAHGHAVKVGGFHYLPANAHHYAYTKSATVLQIHGDGPLDINYVNPADDPQKMGKSG